MLEWIIFCSGALVMVLEMVGSRVLAPHLGTSLIVWTSLIGVVLGCLAVGSWLGGRMADRHVSGRYLSAILAVAGLSTLATALTHRQVGHAVAAAVDNLYFGTVAASVCLLAVPALFFGMVAPYVIRLKLERLDTSGRTVGRLYALSTAGSIVGTFLGGFVLLAWFSTTQILFGVAAGMMILAVAARARRPGMGIALCLVWAGAALLAHGRSDVWANAPAGTQIMETPYNTIVVAEGFVGRSNRRMRLLSTDPGSCQSAVYIDEPQALALDYTHFYGLGAAFKPDASEVLMLGGGGYSVPRWLLAGKSGLEPRALRLDVVELDPGMTDAARKHFGIPDDPRLAILHQDARVFLNRNQKTYDLIFVDVFGSWYSIPFQVGTVEAMTALRRGLAPDGVMIMNIISALEGEKSRLFQAILASVQACFPEAHVFAVRDPARKEEVQNIMVAAFAAPRPDLVSLLERRVPDAPGVARTLTHMLARRVPDKPADLPPLTDDYAPVERYVLPLL